MRLPSASKMERAMLCAGSVVLPQVDQLTLDAHRGQIIHRFLESAAEIGRDAALALMPKEYYVFAEALPLDKLPVKKGGFAAEVAFAYNPTTGEGRELGRGINRDYIKAGLQEGEIACTVDVVGVGEDLVFVGDYKSGHGYVTAAADNWQLKVGALAACASYGKMGAKVAIYPLREDGKIYPDEAEFSALDLTLARQEIVGMLPSWEKADARVWESLPPDVVAGRHCHYCPAKYHCPAVGSWIKTFTSMTEAEPGALAAKLTPETAALALERLDQLTDVMQMVEEALRIFARDQAIPVGDKVWGPISQKQESLDGAATYHIIAKEFGAELAQKAVEWKSTKKRIEDLARELPKTQGDTITARKEKLLKLLRDGGAVQENYIEKFTLHRP